MKMQLIPRWAVDTTGDIRDAATGKVVWFKTGIPTDGLPDLVANAPEMYELIQMLVRTWEDDAQFIPCDTEAAASLSNKLARLAAQAAPLLTKIEGGEE